MAVSQETTIGSIFSSPDGQRIRPSQDYSLPQSGTRRLATLVAEIKRNPIAQKIITPEEMRDMSSRVDAKKVVTALPQGITPEDYYGINGLSLYTESATLTYTDQFVRTARAFDQPWLGEFIEDVWTPDELTHHLPFKQIALDLGASEEALDREIQEAQAREFTHGIGYSPAHITAFGMVQEYLTMRWYQLTHGILKDASPGSIHGATRTAT